MSLNPRSFRGQLDHAPLLAEIKERLAREYAEEQIEWFSREVQMVNLEKISDDMNYPNFAQDDLVSWKYRIGSDRIQFQYRP
jgi:hypothetical protein